METQYFVWAGLAVLLVASLVIAYYSSRTVECWAGGAGLLHFPDRLDLHLFGGQDAEDPPGLRPTGGEAGDAARKAWSRTTPNMKTDIGNLRHEFDKLTANRGGVWPMGKVVRAAPDGTIIVELPPPGPQSIKQDSVLFMFALSVGVPERGQAAATLFRRVQGHGGRRGRQHGDAHPGARPLGAGQAGAGQHSSAGGACSMSCRSTDMTSLPVSTRRSCRPPFRPARQTNTCRDGKPPKEDDPSDRVFGKRPDGTWVSMEVLGDNANVEEKRYVRQLRDYQLLFRELARQRAVDRDAIAQAQHDADQLKEALARAEKDVTYREAEKAKLAADLTGFRKGTGHRHQLSAGPAGPVCQSAIEAQPRPAKAISNWPRSSPACSSRQPSGSIGRPWYPSTCQR